MNFNEEFIKGILDGSKTQTRRLVKEGEMLATNKKNILGKQLPYSEIYNYNWYFNCVSKFYPDDVVRVKWQVGEDYSVQVGKKGLWYCPKCKKSHELLYPDDINHSKNWCDCKWVNLPLRVVIKSIRKEKLLDISEADAKIEGFESKREFRNAFLKIYESEHNKYFLTLGTKLPWNPFVWVLEFEVKKEND